MLNIEFRVSYDGLTTFGQFILKMMLSFGNFEWKNTQSKKFNFIMICA